MSIRNLELLAGKWNVTSHHPNPLLEFKDSITIRKVSLGPVCVKVQNKFKHRLGLPNFDPSKDQVQT